LKNSLYKNEYRIFKPVETTITRGLRKKKNRTDGPIWVIIHICMEMLQENCICSYLKQTKMSFFLFVLQNQRTGEWNRSCLGLVVGASGRGRRGGKGYRMVNIMQILCTHVCKWKIRYVETIPEMGGEEDEGECWRG
jgi:hypothetical protein